MRQCGPGDDDTEMHLDPDWPTWVPNPLKSKRDDATDEDKKDALKLAALLDATCKLIRPNWPSWGSWRRTYELPGIPSRTALPSPRPT